MTVAYIQYVQYVPQYLVAYTFYFCFRNWIVVQIGERLSSRVAVYSDFQFWVFSDGNKMKFDLIYYYF